MKPEDLTEINRESARMILAREAARIICLELRANCQRKSHLKLQAEIERNLRRFRKFNFD